MGAGAHRFLAICIGSLIGLAVCATAAEASQRRVSVEAVVAAPLNFVGQRLSIDGVIIGVNGWKLCSPLLKPRDGWQTNYGAAQCIDLRVNGQSFDAQAEKYHGARASVDGIYWHRCLPDVREADPPVVREECKTDGLNGWIGAVEVHLSGHVVLGELVGKDAPLTEVDASAPEVSGIAAFAKAFVDAAAARDVDALVALFPKSGRGRKRVWLNVPSSRDHWLFMNNAMAPTRARASVAGSGFRAYRSGASDTVELCFCRTAACEGRWPTTGADVISDTHSLATPYVCYSILRSEGRWFFF